MKLLKTFFKIAFFSIAALIGSILLFVIVRPQAASQSTAAKVETAKPVAPSPKPAASTESQWQYENDLDGMGRKRWFALLSSTNTVNFTFPYSGDQHGSLLVQATATEIKDIRFAIDKGQFLCNVIEPCYIHARFDDGAIRRYAVTGPSDRATTLVFIEDVQGFLTALRKAKTVRVEATFYQQGNQAFQFNAAGFDW